MALSNFIEEQIDNLSRYCTGFSPLFNTGVAYYSQRDNYTQGHRTCNTSSNAMYLNWLRLATKRTSLPGGDDAYLKKVLSIGDTVYHENQTKALKAYGFQTKWIDMGNSTDSRNCVNTLLSVGFPVVANILHRGSIENPSGGHVICLIARRQDSGNYIAHDPYGTLESDYTNTDGAYSRITAEQFTARWQGGYRVLA